MTEKTCYEGYPFWIVLLSNIVSFAIYAAGAVVIYKIGWIWLILYIFYIIWLEIKLRKLLLLWQSLCFWKGEIKPLTIQEGQSSRVQQNTNYMESCYP